MRFLKKLVPNAYLALILVFIYLPIAVLIIYSFNSLPKSFIWGGFTFDNYKSLFKGSDGSGILESLLETLNCSKTKSTIFSASARLVFDFLSNTPFTCT